MKFKYKSFKSKELLVNFKLYHKYIWIHIRINVIFPGKLKIYNFLNFKNHFSFKKKLQILLI